MKWKILKENDNYMINKKGEVKRIKTNKMLKLGKIKNGYYTYNLCKNGKQKTYLVHRLVANNFIPNIYGYNEINHKDGDKSNNNVNNLEWCSRSHNLKEAYKLRLKSVPRSEKNVNSKKVLEYNLINGEIKVWNCFKDIEREKGYSTGALHYACQKPSRIYKSSHWEYV